MPRRQRGDTSSTLVVRTSQCPVSKSGDCAALKAQKGRFESDAGHQFGAAAGAELSLARMMCWVRFPDAPPNSFRSSALGVCIRLLIGPRLVRIQRPEPIAAFVYWLGCRVLNPVKWDRYPYAAPVSSRSSTGRAPCYERGGCRFDSCREGQSSGCRGAQSSPPALEAGERWCESNHPDHSTRCSGETGTRPPAKRL